MSGLGPCAARPPVPTPHALGPLAGPGDGVLVSLAAGAAHSLFLTDLGVVFGCGDASALPGPPERDDQRDAGPARLLATPGHWAVILARGGHFAAALFDVHPPGGGRGGPPAVAVRHKTAHRYVVR